MEGGNPCESRKSAKFNMRSHFARSFCIWRMVGHSRSTIPSFLFLGHSERTAIVDDVDGSFEVIDPLLVTSLSVASVKAE